MVVFIIHIYLYFNRFHFIDKSHRHATFFIISIFRFPVCKIIKKKTISMVITMKTREVNKK